MTYYNWFFFFARPFKDTDIIEFQKEISKKLYLYYLLCTNWTNTAKTFNTWQCKINSYHRIYYTRVSGVSHNPRNYNIYTCIWGTILRSTRMCIRLIFIYTVKTFSKKPSLCILERLIFIYVKLESNRRRIHV